MSLRGIGLLVLMFCVACELPDGRDEYGTTPLMRAAEAGNAAEVRRLLDKGADVNARVKPHPSFRELLALVSLVKELPKRSSGWSALMFAVSNDRVDAARLLLERGADPNVEAHGLRPLDLAVSPYREPRLAMMRLLVRHGADVHPARRGHLPHPVVAAAGAGDTALLRLMLQRGFSVNGASQDGRTALMAAAENAERGAVRLLLAAGATREAQDGNGWSASRFALAAGDTALAAEIGGQDAVAGERFNTALMAAVSSGDVAAMRRALDAGASVQARDERGRSVLHRAMNDAPEKGALLLLARGAQPGPDETRSVVYLAIARGFVMAFDTLVARGYRVDDELLVEAARMGRPEIVERLVARGLDVNTQNGEPMRRAAKFGQTESVKTLLRLGGKWDIPNRVGTTAMSEACTRGRSDIVKLLAQAGADTLAAAAGCVKT